MSEPFALYVHVPWCRHVCPYCDFNVYARAEPPERDYTATLLAELSAHARDGTWQGRPAKSVYLGGGTPSLFSPGAIARVLDGVERLFGIVAGAEVTLEANPGTVTGETLRGHRAAGVNRLSLGAQSFNPAHLRTLGRDHGADDIATAVEAAARAGIANVSLDLIYATPGATVDDWQRDLAAAIALAPAHVSAYCLTYEEGTPFHAWRASGRLRDVDEEVEAEMAEVAGAALAAAGYARYEISSWARPGFQARHNLSYWDGSDYLGVGAGAHSFAAAPAPGRRWSNERDPERHRMRVAEAGTAIAREEQLTEHQARGEFMMTGLRQIAGVDLAAFRGRFAEDADRAFPHIVRLVGDGLLERAQQRLRLTESGLRFADDVAASFL